MRYRLPGYSAPPQFSGFHLSHSPSPSYWLLPPYRLHPFATVNTFSWRQRSNLHVAVPRRVVPSASRKARVCLRKLTRHARCNLRPDAGARRGTLYVHCGVRHTFSNVQTVAQLNGESRSVLNTLEVSVMRTRLKRPAALPACRWFSASVPAYGRYAAFFHGHAHFVADLSPVFAASWLTRSFRRCSTPAT